MEDNQKAGDPPAEDKLPDAQDLAQLVRDYALNQSDMDEARGKNGALVKNAEKDKNVHRKAFKILCQVEKMDGTKRSEFLLHLGHYLKVRGHTPSKGLFDDKPADPPATKGKASTVRRDAAALSKLEGAVN